MEIVARVFRGYDDRDLESILDHVHPDVEIDYSNSSAPDASVYHGIAACRAFVQGRYDYFEQTGFVAAELIDAPPDAVIAVGNLRATGRASGVTIEAPNTTLWTLGDGKVLRIKLYQSRAEALQAAGLSE